MKEVLLPIFWALFSLVVVTTATEPEQLTTEPNNQPAAILPTAINPGTTSSFETSEYTTNRTIPFKRRYELNPNLPCGQEEVQQEGREGKVVKRFRRIIWGGEPLTDELLAIDEQPAVDEVVALGIRPGETFTVDGHQYNCILKNFWATSYDGKCRGCSGRTHYTNEPVAHGICAVNPELIPPTSYFYVPGYGRCKAADKGGGLKGRHIDLGFDNVKNGWWSARYTDVYLLR